MTLSFYLFGVTVEEQCGSSELGWGSRVITPFFLVLLHVPECSHPLEDVLRAWPSRRVKDAAGAAPCCGSGKVLPVQKGRFVLLQALLVSLIRMHQACLPPAHPCSAFARPSLALRKVVEKSFSPSAATTGSVTQEMSLRMINILKGETLKVSVKQRMGNAPGFSSLAASHEELYGMKVVLAGYSPHLAFPSFSIYKKAEITLGAFQVSIK